MKVAWAWQKDSIHFTGPGWKQPLVAHVSLDGHCHGTNAMFQVTAEGEHLKDNYLQWKVVRDDVTTLPRSQGPLDVESLSTQDSYIIHVRFMRSSQRKNVRVVFHWAGYRSFSPEFKIKTKRGRSASLTVGATGGSSRLPSSAKYAAAPPPRLMAPVPSPFSSSFSSSSQISTMLQRHQNIIQAQEKQIQQLRGEMQFLSSRLDRVSKATHNPPPAPRRARASSFVLHDDNCASSFMLHDECAAAVASNNLLFPDDGSLGDTSSLGGGGDLGFDFFS